MYFLLYNYDLWIRALSQCQQCFLDASCVWIWSHCSGGVFWQYYLTRLQTLTHSAQYLFISNVKTPWLCAEKKCTRQHQCTEDDVPIFVFEVIFSYYELPLFIFSTTLLCNIVLTSLLNEIFNTSWGFESLLLGPPHLWLAVKVLD